MSLLPLGAQVATNPAPISTEAAANPAPAGQAPEEATKKITDLVHAGKFAEAQKLTDGLLIAYPDDQRLIKAKALIEKLLTPASPANTTPSDNQRTSNGASLQLGASINPVQFTGMDRVEYNSLIELARQAQQTADLEQQKVLLQQFMERSSAFLQKHPDQILLWQLRAASALSLNDMMAGYEAGQRLLVAGAADSNDPNLQQLLSKLNLNGWLDKRNVEEIEANKEAQATAEANGLKEDHDKYTFPVRHGNSGGSLKGYGHLTVNENDVVYEGSDGTVRFPKSVVPVITLGGLYRDGIKFYPKDMEHSVFYLTTEPDVVNKTVGNRLPVSAIGSAVVERWRFVSTDGNRTLRPPAP
jgi:hypothetical protein